MGKGISTLLGVLGRRGFPAVTVFASVIGASFAYLAVTPRLYETSARLMLDDKKASVSELGRDLTQINSTAIGRNPLADQAELLKSQTVLQLAISKLNPPIKDSSTQKPLTASDIRSNLKVIIVPATNILDLRYQSPNPNQAAQILNAVSQAMVEENIKTISSEATKVREFLAEKVPIARQRLLQAELAETKYRQQSGVVATDDQTRSLVNSLAELENQERILAVQLQETRSRDASLRQVTDAKNINTAYASVREGQDEQLKVLRTKLTDIETKLIEARTKYQEAHPTVLDLVQQRDEIRALYGQQMARVSSSNQTANFNNLSNDQISQTLISDLITNDITRLAVENKLNAIQKMRANIQSRLALIPIQQQPLTVLTRQREEAAESLKFLQSKLEEAQIAEAQKVSNIRIIETAVAPELPTSPKRTVVLVIAGFFGSILAVGLVLLLELMDNTLRDATEAEELLQLPLLGVLPRLPATKLSLEPAEQFLDDLGLVEPYRMLLKNLEFRNVDNLQVIVVSSPLAGEGKSVIVSHLAAVSAMLSRRTLIIDADLRKPSQHTLFNLPPRPGITDVIDGTRPLLSAVQSTTIENLSVLTCGELRGRPSQILESAAMKALVAEAAQRYDLVIIDTPPLSACADASTLSQMSDGVILTTRPGFTLKEVLQRAVSELNQNRIPVLGVVVNGMTSGTEKYYRYPSEEYPSILSRPLRRLTSLGSSARNSANDSRSN
ncbi:Lipopolysaccharide biosynthesis [Trichormus variabilis ATCC 29413]|uniref:Lipopolysaccharide biosynthesis n=2 Tax=Anabaena variabilis TaxID=264691 RepID=Q3MEW0_TRIV2|nr:MULTISPECIES: polysaccharide biosynthesis tyrosine autokinase [Nostocaceae]ABA20476.1 Lipopolysaccharide biosynthesis [Trichormus variabilis ATCC 29413]MBC1215799.1 polysaccharide biosynthesis tyrosine autokinase [Trichormus variabilis ARAD]MBC1257125.1 polysaccharide biosynthesis tyrosine autokinase [Trichormus variabilis V5]MBC1267977.1 polysaccharide biosynthesis tyrosine autokinase [Trichormus variabilis FSR]MBC1304373.1 polysaccharide biosynthesis tyrosine autokinase [Trichormus variab